MAPDPLEGDPSLPTSLNRLAYAADDPVTLWDPTGLLAQVTQETGGKRCGRWCQQWVDEQGDDLDAGTSPAPSPSPSVPGAGPGGPGSTPGVVVRILARSGDLLGMLDDAADATERAAQQAFDEAGARIGNEIAAIRASSRGWALRSSLLGRLARSGWGRALGAISAGLTFAADYAQSASDPENTTAEALIHAGGVTAGTAVGGAAAVAVFCGSTAGLGCLALATVGGGAVGALLGDRAGDALIDDNDLRCVMEWPDLIHAGRICLDP
jgi:hypothetical protein